MYVSRCTQKKHKLSERRWRREEKADKKIPRFSCTYLVRPDTPVLTSEYLPARMVVGPCDILSELLSRGLENIVVKILSHTDVKTATACLLVNSSWSSNLRDIWRLLLREKKKNQTSFR